MKHTPGPLIVDQVFDPPLVTVTEEGVEIEHATIWVKTEAGRIVSEAKYIKTKGGQFVDNLEEAKANAKLIASAPDLLEALNDLVFTCKKLWDEVKPIKDSGAMTVTHPSIEKAIEAINKATSP